MDKNYTESSIQVLKGLEPVRKRPGMYIGSTDSKGLHHLLWEIIDNCIDEVLSGNGDKIDITIHKDNSIEVEDNGRGIPIGINPSTKVSTIETVFTILHAGGKFNSDSYKVSGGLHGVGASVVNALSEWLKVTVKRDGTINYMSFSNGGNVKEQLREIGKATKTGTKVHFFPDKLIFKTIDWNFTLISERLRESAFLLKNLRITLNDLRTNTKDEYFYKNGLVEYVSFINDNSTQLSNVIYFQAQNNHKIEFEVAMQWTNGYSETILTFANNVKTVDGGSHEIGFKNGLRKAFNDFARKQGFLKDKHKNFEGSDVREGLTAVISLKIPEAYLEYEGQTKSKLGSPEVRPFVEDVIENKLGFWFQENIVEAEKIITKALEAVQARESARQARDDVRKIKNTLSRDTKLSGKLTPAQSKDKNVIELFLVEGESAGGSAKLARDKKTQAILPLKGKVINAEKTKITEILKNEEILAIINTIGGNVGADFDLEGCKYNKIIIMTDADVDGAHIRALILTFFFRYMKPLIENKKIFIALAPLYKFSNNKITEYAWSDEELNDLKEKYGNGQIQRYKGLGEMNFDQLKDTTMNPSNRRLILVNLDDAALSEKRVQTLMGNDAEIRKKWINENVDFTESV